MKHFRHLYLIPALLIMLAACRVSDSPTGIGDSKGNITTTIAGMVNDENGQPIEGAMVTANSKTTRTDRYGTFVLKNISVPTDRCFILCKKNGYFTGSRAETPVSGGITELRVTMQHSTANYSVESASGGKITLGNASVTFLPASFTTTYGTPYTGTAKVAVRFLDPTQDSFYNSFSGDMTAKRLDGSQTELLSYGVLRVQITDDSGNELKLAVGKKAILTYPIATSMKNNAPVSIPLWYFDESMGMWHEEGSAVKSGDFYIGEVSHFSDWNLDIPQVISIIKGRVFCKNETVGKIYVTVGQRKTITDKEGYFSCQVPINSTISVLVAPSDNNGLSAPEVIVQTSSTPGIEYQVTLQLTNCPAFITGTLIDCNAQPIAGRIIVFHQNGSSCYYTSTGDFKVIVAPDVELTLEATAFDGRIAFARPIGTVNSESAKDIAQVSACDEGKAADYHEIYLGSGEINGTVLSPDGSMIAVTGNRAGLGDFSEVYECATGKKLCQFSGEYLGAPINFSDDGTKLLIGYLIDNIRHSYIVNPRTGTIIQKFPKSWQSILLPNGSSVITYNYSSQVPSPRVSLYSVQNGKKIKDLSFSDEGENNWDLVGTRGSNKFVMLNGYLKNNHYTSLQVKIIDWDIASDRKTNELILDGSYYFTEPSPSPDFSVISLYQTVDTTPYSQLNFYDTQSGQRINSFAVEADANRRDIGISNDLKYVRQPYKEDPSKIVQPDIHNLTDGKLLKSLSVASDITQYERFTYSANSQYLSAVEVNYNFQRALVIRIWKIK